MKELSFDRLRKTSVIVSLVVLVIGLTWAARELRGLHEYDGSEAALRRILAQQQEIAEEQVSVKLVKEQDGQIYVCWENGDNGHLFLTHFQQRLGGNRLKHLGFSSSNVNWVNDYYREKLEECPPALLVIFGDNSDDAAQKYSFAYGQKRYETVVPDGYFIDIYTFGEVAVYENGIVYGKSGEELLLFKP